MSIKTAEEPRLGHRRGFTNSYGIPIDHHAIQLEGYELKVDMSSGMKVSVATWLNKKLKLGLTALDTWDDVAVHEVDGKSKNDLLSC